MFEAVRYVAFVLTICIGLGLYGALLLFPAAFCARKNWRKCRDQSGSIDWKRVDASQFVFDCLVTVFWLLAVFDALFIFLTGR